MCRIISRGLHYRIFLFSGSSLALSAHQFNVIDGGKDIVVDCTSTLVHGTALEIDRLVRGQVETGSSRKPDFFREILDALGRLTLIPLTVEYEVLLQADEVVCLLQRGVFRDRQI